jgi:hypothetical protein
LELEQIEANLWVFEHDLTGGDPKGPYNLITLNLEQNKFRGSGEEEDFGRFDFHGQINGDHFMIDQIFKKSEYQDENK